MQKIITDINNTGVNHCLCPIKDGCSCENWWVIDPNHDLDLLEEKMDERKNIHIAFDPEFDAMQREWDSFVLRVEELGQVMLNSKDNPSNLGEWVALGITCKECGREIYTKSDLQGIEHDCGCGKRFYRID